MVWLDWKSASFTIGIFVICLAITLGACFWRRHRRAARQAARRTARRRDRRPAIRHLGPQRHLNAPSLLGLQGGNGRFQHSDIEQVELSAVGRRPPNRLQDRARLGTNMRSGAMNPARNGRVPVQHQNGFQAAIPNAQRHRRLLEGPSPPTVIASRFSSTTSSSGENMENDTSAGPLPRTTTSEHEQQHIARAVLPPLRPSSQLVGGRQEERPAAVTPPSQLFESRQGGTLRRCDTAPALISSVKSAIKDRVGEESGEEGVKQKGWPRSA